MITGYLHECIDKLRDALVKRSWKFLSTEDLPETLECEYCHKTVPLSPSRKGDK